jgi:arsenate reductase
MPKATLYHNPRCSKSREALVFLEQHCEQLAIVEYLKSPLNKAQLIELYSALNIQSAHQMIRPQEDEYKLANLRKGLSDDEILSAVAKYPKLLERPILQYGNKAAIGRPLDHIVSLLHA